MSSVFSARKKQVGRGDSGGEAVLLLVSLLWLVSALLLGHELNLFHQLECGLDLATLRMRPPCTPAA